LGSLALLLIIASRDFFPVPPDAFYHLRVAQQIIETGRVPLWNSWEFAPAGRPHLYPPVFHILLAFAARLAGNDLILAYRLILALSIASVYSVVWYAARYFYGPRQAFVALILVGSDVMFLIVNYLATPSMLALAVALLALVLLSARHPLCAGAMGALSFYVHPALFVPTLAGYLVWIFWTRPGRIEWRSFLSATTVFLVLAAPWLMWMIRNRGYFQHPLETGLYGHYSGYMLPFVKVAWLQLVSATLLLLVVRSLRHFHWRDARNRLFLCCAAAHLPTLLSYGGRYYANTLPFWSVLAAGLLAPLVKQPLTLRRSLPWVALALCPTVVLAGFGSVVPPGPFPVPSAWVAAPLAAAGCLEPFGEGERLGLPSSGDARLVGEYIRDHTRPDQVIYFESRRMRDFALMIGFYAGRAINIGAWEETAPPDGGDRQRQQAAMQDAAGVYVQAWPEGLPSDTSVERVAGYYVAIRPASLEPVDPPGQEH